MALVDRDIPDIQRDQKEIARQSVQAAASIKRNLLHAAQPGLQK